MQPTQHTSIDLPVGEDCPTCRSWHLPDEPCWFTNCQSCGGAFVFGGSADPECGTCASAPELHDDAEESVSEVGFTPANTLRDMVLYTDRYGWNQGDYYDRTAAVLFPPACIVAGLGMVCYGERFDAPALQFEHPGFGEFEAAMAWLERYLVDRFPDGDDNGNPMTAYGFNDARGRTYDQVRAVVLAAADLWERIYLGPVPGPECCGTSMAECPSSPSVALVPGPDADVYVSRVFQCVHCGRWANVEVVDSLEREYFIADAFGLTDGADDPQLDSYELDVQEQGGACQLCGAPGGYPFCANGFGGSISCAEVAAVDFPGGAE
ncbi:hypothetical protein Val02_93610 [Virgisporangium aliadipatigenens]|uniref:Uncharacterized protein n=1 Tax=Virgisporangium aliadipatigenens TaxID=741659 RepID=A0A8J3YZE3_9ACTN|nr:hypothetical protein [Virgisporangium aliadipatigenens]GIJ52475.1 hypothetical protein Val02_93610 [Virgisporangium aliadipatigenens]